MASGRVLLAVIVSLILGSLAQVVPSSPTASGQYCSTSSTTGLRALDASLFESLKSGTTASFSGIPSSDKTNNAQAITAFAKGKCQKWGIDAGESGYLETNSLAWTEWDLRAHSGSVSVILQLTGPQSTDVVNQRLTIVSIVSGVLDTQKCNASQSATFNQWNCEAFITDSCQGYEVTDQKAWTFTGGLRYFLIFDAPQTSGHTFHLDMVPRGATISAQGWETGVTAVTGSAGQTAGSLPAGWTRSSRNWDIFPTFEGRIAVPGWSSWPIWTGPAADSVLIGELGYNIIMNNPNWIPGRDSASTITCQSAGEEANCDHHDDSLYSAGYATGANAGAKFQLEIETFWYDGANDENDTPSGVATIYASTTGGDAALDWTLIYTLPSLFTNNWGLERIEIPTEFTDGGSVFFKFNLASTDNKLGWALNTISVVPEIEFDLCKDTVGCTQELCSNAFDKTVDGDGITIYTPVKFGCYNPPDTTTCQSKGAEGATCKTWVCNPDESLDENSDPAVDADGCEAIEDPDACDEGRSCLTGSCNDVGICEYEINTQYTCSDSRGCTVDSCPLPDEAHYDEADDTTGCYFEASCDDHVECTTDSCEAGEAEFGGDRCLHTIDINICEDNIDCTYELVCDPEQPGMDPITGCIRIPMDEWCDDGKACTIDTCEPLTEGEAGMEASDRCFNRPVDCDDCIQCTVDSCDEETGECVNEADDDLCNDNQDCTEDVCNKALGKCQNIPRDDWCYEERDGLTGCEIFECRPFQEGEAGDLSANSDARGCLQTTMDCDDDLACTTDTCVNGACEFEANEASCHDDLECTFDTCSKELGKCVNLPDSSMCEDNDVCTVNFCGRDGMCHFPLIDCSDDIYCTDDSCDGAEGTNEGCEHEANHDKCEDNWDCTDDLCDTNLGGCTNLPNHKFCADENDKCHTWVCNVASAEAGSDGCVALFEKDCDDGIPCTEDSCTIETGVCVNNPIKAECDDGKPCTDDVCDPVLGCVHTPNDANCEIDGDACTIDTCGCDGTCKQEIYHCDDNIACTDDKCVDVEGEATCVFDIKADACDDDITCTVDTCDKVLGRCNNIETDSLCAFSADGCYVEECSIEHEGCVPTFNHDICDDHIPCTFDECTVNGCVHTEMNSLCNDGIDCTLDSCSIAEMGCVFEPILERCDDFSNCTTHFCSATAGCVIVPHNELCDDDIECTENVCDSPAGVASGCSYYPKNENCDDGVGCTDDICSATTGCDHVPIHSRCDDGWNCTGSIDENGDKVDICDVSAGCQYDDDACPWATTQTLCLECTTSSAQILQLNYTDGTGAMQFATRDSETDELKTNIVALPTDQVIIGGSSQNEVRVGAADGLVINDNLRLVPLDSSSDLPACNEIRRGSITVVPVAVACGDNTCHRDTVMVCSKQQDYEWVTLQKSE